MLSSLSPARRRFILALVAIVAVGALVIGVSLVRESTVDPVAQGSPGPVLLVPGYGGSVASLEPLAEALEGEGRTVAVVPPPAGGQGDLAEQAENLAEVAERERDSAGADSVDVIGYSAGGVVARLWVKNHGGASVARRVLTLASPHHGVEVARLALDVVPDSCPEACQQLAPDSDLLRALNAEDETPAGPLFVSIWSTSDEVVTPAESARLDGALNVEVQSLCAGEVSHGGVPGNVVVLGALSQVLGTDAPELPAAVDCAAVSS